MSEFKESDVQVFTLKNEHGMEAKFINYGAILVSLRVPDRNGTAGEVTLGKYANNNCFKLLDLKFALSINF